MGFRIYKRISLGKGFGLNISKSGISPSYRSKSGSVGSKGYSLRTGIPGITYRKTFGKSKNSGCLLVLIGFTLAFLISTASCENEKSKKEVEYPKNSSERVVNKAASEKKWYLGGSLQKSKNFEWKKASEENKLATCGDFCAIVYKDNSLDEIKVKATNLRVCIDEAARDHSYADNENVSKVASMCLILIEN